MLTAQEMQRLDELKAMGDPRKLTGKDREDYRALIAKGEQTGEQEAEERAAGSGEAPPTPPAEPENITVSAKDFQKLLEDMEQLKKENQAHQVKGSLPVTVGKWVELDSRPKTYTAKMKKWRKTTDDEYAHVIDWKFIKMVWDPETRKNLLIYRFTMLKSDDTTFEVEFDIGEFANMLIYDYDYEDVKIIETKKKKLVKLHDTFVTKKTYEEVPVERSSSGLAMNPSGLKEVVHGQVRLTESKDEIINVVQLADGRTIEIPAERLNPA